MIKNVKLKSLKPVPKIQDPIRYPKVTGMIEKQSKEDFERSLSLESKMLLNLMNAEIE